MPANIRETKIGFGYKKQTDLSTPNVSGDIWSLTKINAALSTVTLNTENDAAELGKGHEFATLDSWSEILNKNSSTMPASGGE